MSWNCSLMMLQIMQIQVMIIGAYTIVPRENIDHCLALYCLVPWLLAESDKRGHLCTELGSFLVSWC